MTFRNATRAESDFRLRLNGTVLLTVPIAVVFHPGSAMSVRTMVDIRGSVEQGSGTRLASRCNRAEGETMRQSDERRRHSFFRCPVNISGVRLVTGSLIACMAASSMAAGAAAGTPNPLEALSVGNAGTSTASSTSTLTTGDINGGGNIGNTIYTGDIINSTAEITGGTSTNPTYNIISMPAGTQIATADGGNGTQAELDGAGPPIDLALDVQNGSKNSNSTKNSNLATGGDSSSTSDATNNNTNTGTNTSTNTNTGTNTNDNTGTNGNTNGNTNTLGQTPP